MRRCMQTLFPVSREIANSPNELNIYGQHVPNAIFTVNYCAPWHIDPKDCMAMSHCIFSPPDNWHADCNLTTEKNYHPKCVFGIGNKIFDISSHAMRISWLPGVSYHCTSKPHDVPPLPHIYKGKRCLSVVSKYNPKSFLNKSIIAWGGWTHQNNQTFRDASWNDLVAGIRDERVTADRRRQLHSNWCNAAGY